MDPPFVPYDFQREPQPVLDNLIRTSGTYKMVDGKAVISKDVTTSPVKQVLSTILRCAKDSTQTIYSLDIDSFEDDMLVIRADLFLEFLQQEIEKLDE